MYRRAINTLEQIVPTFDASATRAQVVALRSLGDALRVAGDFDRAIESLQNSLSLATQLQLPQEIAATQLSLGNTAYAQSKAQIALDNPAEARVTTQQARDYYQQAMNGSGAIAIQLQAQLNDLQLLIDTEQDSAIQSLLLTLTPQLDRLPASHSAIFTRINFAHSLLKWQQQGQPIESKTIAQLLATAIEQAQSLQDLRAESFARGNLGTLYEQQQQWIESQQVTTKALQLAQQIQAADLEYLWQWQIGRIFNRQQQREGAIKAYQGSVDTLKFLRQDLTAINPDVQFSFRDSVEPLYRQFVSLLLQPGVEPSQTHLAQAQKAIEALQVAELDNFFRTACLNAEERQIDQIDRHAAVLYPIVLEDRLEVILNLPGNELRHYTAADVTRQTIEERAMQLSAFLKQSTSKDRFLPLAQQFYDWLIRPAEAELANSQIKTLVFVLDGVLRNIPMAVLHDGTQYLVEKPYSLAVTPGLQLLESQPLQHRNLNVLLGGLSKARPPNFSALPNVPEELSGIQSEVPRHQALLNERFTNAEIQKAISEVPFPVVHLATHGIFNANLEDTFLLTWDDQLNVNQLGELLQSTDLGRRPIELLVLSACETAEGNNRAALGLAGISVQSGARSTIATLWQVNDEAMSVFMKRLYHELTQPEITKAEALRQTQLSLLTDADNSQYSQPYYWSSVILVGNWQ
jgi:CHAT domain-containing protein